MKENKITKKPIELPNGYFCSGNCAEPRKCIYWVPEKRDSNGRQYCSHYSTHYYPYERNGCLSKED